MPIVVQIQLQPLPELPPRLQLPPVRRRRRGRQPQLRQALLFLLQLLTARLTQSVLIHLLQAARTNQAAVGALI